MSNKISHAKQFFHGTGRVSYKMLIPINSTKLNLVSWGWEGRRSTSLSKQRKILELKYVTRAGKRVVLGVCMVVSVVLRGSEMVTDG